jgi:hypothetical protein
MPHTSARFPQAGFLKTSRKDNWWVSPLITFLVFTTFIVYATWAALQNAYYWVPGTEYLSPFYAPEFFGNSPHAILGAAPTWWPSFLPYSPAILILWAPVGFRMTCYYYRGSYYKAFIADPVACSVGEPRKSYKGERSLLIIQNAHRYFLPFAVLLIVFLTWDAIKATQFEGHFGIGVGTLIMFANAILLGSYTFGCHALRHFAGGRKNCLPKGPISKNCYDCVSSLNRRHMLFAWCSLFSVGLCDLYIRLCSMGIITDFRII